MATSFQSAFEKSVELEVQKIKTKQQQWKNFACDKCGIAFVDRYHFNTHVCSKESTEMCSVCQKTFPTAWHLKQHICIRVPYECALCKIPFIDRHRFSTHFCSEKSKGKMCSVCQKTFSTAWYLKQHMLIHSGEKPYECELCKARFSIKSNLTRHALLIHRNGKPYSCTLCNESYAQIVELKNHMNSHTGTNNYECDVCSKRFSERSELARHRIIHLKLLDKPFRCDVCDKTFSLRVGLKEHMYTHSEKKPHQCDQCNRSFTWKYRLKIHRLIHSPTGASKISRCQVCKKRFSTKLLLDRHIESAHTTFESLMCDSMEVDQVKDWDQGKDQDHDHGKDQNQDQDKGQDQDQGKNQDQNTSVRYQVSIGDLFQCQACSNVFLSRSLFMNHIAFHRDYKCLECLQIYAYCGCFKPSLEDFEKADDNLKCSFSNTQFFYESHLHKHLLNHKCPVCLMARNDCVCIKEEVDNKPTTEELITQEYDDFKDQLIDIEKENVKLVEEDLTLKKENENKPEIDQEFLVKTPKESCELTNELLANVKEEKPAIITEECFLKEENDRSDCLCNK